MTQQDNKPFSIPTGWPQDKRSKLASMIGIGWVLTHPERETMLHKDGKWQIYPQYSRGVA